MNMTRTLISIVVAGALSVGPALYGQDSAQKKQQDQQQADRPGEETVTGCLTEQAGSYMLSTTAGEQLSVSGSADFSKHKNHTVKLTGKKDSEGGKTKLNVSKIEHVSPSCSK